jgi:hypothetical protein
MFSWRARDPLLLNSLRCEVIFLLMLCGPPKKKKTTVSPHNNDDDNKNNVSAGSTQRIKDSTTKSLPSRNPEVKHRVETMMIHD